MPMIQPDFTQAAGGKLEHGEYPVRVTNAEVKFSKTSGAPYVRWELEVFGKSDDSLNGRKTWHNTPTTGKGAGILKSFLEACGVASEGEFDTEALYGKELIVVLGPDKDPSYTVVKAVKTLH